MSGPVADAASKAPHAPGVYFFLAPDGELLYVGKAGNLRKRLQQHALAKGETPRNQKYVRVDEVRWVVLPDEDAAAAYEADVIVALCPPFNAFADEGRWAYVVVERSGLDLCFDVTPSPGPLGGSRRAYGCFPHLGRGVSLRPAVACSDGYTAFLRLLWAASGDGRHVPARLTRSAPAAWTTTADPSLDAPLHAFLSGVSARVLDTLALAIPDRPDFMRPALQRDVQAAHAFFRAGPQAVRRLRLSGGGPPGPMSRHVIEELIRARVRDGIAAFR